MMIVKAAAAAAERMRSPVCLPGDYWSASRAAAACITTAGS